MNSVDHIPQTLASHIRLPEESPPRGLEEGRATQHGADMLKPDPRDTFYSSKSRLSFSLIDRLTVWLPVSLAVSVAMSHIVMLSFSLSSVPMINPFRLENVLPACLYSPTYVVKDFPIARYQGLQFVSQPFSHFSPSPPPWVEHLPLDM